MSDAIQTSIQINEEGARHIIAYKIGSTVLFTSDLGAGTQHTCTVPTSAGAHFPISSLTGVLSVEVTTTVNGENRGMIASEVELTPLPTPRPPAVASQQRRAGAG